MVWVFRLNALDLSESGEGFSDGDSMQGESAMKRDVDLPRANEVDCNLFKGLSDFIARRRMSMWDTWMLLLLAMDAMANVFHNTTLHAGEPKVLFEGLHKPVFACMSKGVMKPKDGVFDQGFRQHNFPLVVGSLATDELSAMKGLNVKGIIISQRKQCGISLLLGLNVVKGQRESVNLCGVEQEHRVELVLEDLISDKGRIQREPGQGVCCDVVLSRQVGEGWGKLFHEEAPMEESVGPEVVASQVLVVSEDFNFSTPEDGSVFLKGFSDAKGF